MEKTELEKMLVIHAIKEMFYAFAKNGGDLDYCANQVWNDVLPFGIAKGKQDALKEVGEWLKDCWSPELESMACLAWPYVIKALCKGRMP